MTTEERNALAAQLTDVLERNAFLEEENARLRTRLKAQIAQVGELTRQLGRRLDGGPSPRYLVATDGHIIDTGEAADYPQETLSL